MVKINKFEWNGFKTKKKTYRDILVLHTQRFLRCVGQWLRNELVLHIDTVRGYGSPAIIDYPSCRNVRITVELTVTAIAGVEIPVESWLLVRSIFPILEIVIANHKNRGINEVNTRLQIVRNPADFGRVFTHFFCAFKNMCTDDDT